MILRLGAAIGVALILVTNGSCAMARSSDQNRNKVNVVATGIAIMGIASTYNPFRPDYRSGGRETASMIQQRGLLQSKRICVRGLVASALARPIDRHTL